MKRYPKRNWTLWLSLVLLLSLPGLWYGLAQARETDSLAQTVGQPQADAREELLEMRARNRKVFRYNEPPRMVDGQAIERRTMVASLGSLHYKDTDGRWQDVDTTLIDTGSEYRVDKVNAPARLPKVGVDPLIIQAGNEPINVRLVGAQPSPASLRAGPGAAHPQHVTFPDILPQTDFAYEVEPDGVREFITLKAPGHPTEFTFQVVTQLNMSLENGEVIFRDQANTIVGVLNRPWLTAPGVPLETRVGAFSLTGNRVTMSLPDLTGLAYPIVVDPTYSINADVNDGYAVTYFNYWYNTSFVNISFGKGYDTQEFDPALRWDAASAIPQGTQITAASVTVRAYDTQSSNTVKTKIRAAKNSDTDVIDSYTEWYNTPRTMASVSWTFGSWAPLDQATSPDIASVIQEAVNHSGFNGTFLLFFDDDGSTPGAFRNAYDYRGSSTYAPQLSITYNVKPIYLYTHFTDKDNATAMYGLTATAAQNIQVDYQEDRGSGFGNYTTYNLTPLGVGSIDTLCIGYAEWARWQVDLSTSSAKNVKWRVRVPANLTVKDLATTACTSHTTTEAHAFSVYRGDSFTNGTTSIETHVGLGIWP